MNPEKWTPDDVAAHLYEIGLGKYGAEFVSNGISGNSLFSLTDKSLRDLGFSAANRTTFATWVSSLHKLPRSNKAIDAGRRIASPKTSSMRSSTKSLAITNFPSSSVSSEKSTTSSKSPTTTATTSVSSVSSRLFTASLSRKRPQDEYVEYRPRITGAMRYGGQSDDGNFNINDLSFSPGPQMKEVPKRIMPVNNRKRRMNNRFDVPEEGSMDNRSPCRFCGRKFAVDRLSKHESVCCMTRSSHRRPFNSKKQRMQGTANGGGVYGTKHPPPKPDVKRSRRPGEKPHYIIEHEELVRALRAARMAECGQGMGARMPPPPKIGMDERMQCPYCGRRFGIEQCERHMRHCENNRPVMKGAMTTCKAARGGTLRY